MNFVKVARLFADLIFKGENFKISKLIDQRFQSGSKCSSVGCLMIGLQVWHRCQSLQKNTYIKKNDGFTFPPLAGLRYSRWRSRWPTTQKYPISSGTIGHRDMFLVPRIGFLGSGNPNNTISTVTDHHVTLTLQIKVTTLKYLAAAVQF